MFHNSWVWPKNFYIFAALQKKNLLTMRGDYMQSKSHCNTITAYTICARTVLVCGIAVFR